MKKMFLLLAAIATIAMVGCGKDDNGNKPSVDPPGPEEPSKPSELPIDIDGVDIPYLTATVGDDITVKGTGFLAYDKVSLRSLSAPDDKAKQIVTDLKSVDATQLVFTLPDEATNKKGYILRLVRGDDREEVMGVLRPDGEKTAMPDAALRKKMMEYAPYAFDTKGNVFNEDAAATSLAGGLKLIDAPIESLVGLEAFGGFTDLWICNTKVKNLDMSKFPSVVNLMAWGPAAGGGSIETVDFGSQPSGLRQIQLERNKLKRVDVSNILILTKLILEGNPLEYLDIRNMSGTNPDISYTYIYKNPTTHVNFKFISDKTKERILKVEQYWWRALSAANLIDNQGYADWLTSPNPVELALKDGVTVECYDYCSVDGEYGKLVHKHTPADNPEVCPYP